MNLTGLGRITITTKIKAFFPEIVKNGKRIELTEDQAIKIVEDLRKKGFVQPVNNQQVPVNNQQVQIISQILEPILKQQSEFNLKLLQEIKQITNQPKQIEYKQAHIYYTIEQYANKFGLELSESNKIKIGKMAAKKTIQAKQSYSIIPDDNFEKVGKYPENILKICFAIFENEQNELDF